MKIYNVATGKHEEPTDADMFGYLRGMSDVNMALWARVRELEARHPEEGRWQLPPGEYDVLVLPRTTRDA